MSTPSTVVTALTVGAAVGLVVGVPVGRAVERVAHLAAQGIIRVRFAEWMLRSLAGWLGAAAVLVALIGAAVVWLLH